MLILINFKRRCGYNKSITGGVDGVVDFSGLKEKVKQHNKLNVLNGIAYKKTFFCNW